MHVSMYVWLDGWIDVCDECNMCMCVWCVLLNCILVCFCYLCKERNVICIM